MGTLKEKLAKAFANALFGKGYAEQFKKVSAALEKQYEVEIREGKTRNDEWRRYEEKKRSRASWNRIEDNAARIHYRAKNGKTPKGTQHYRYRVSLNSAISEQIVWKNAKSARLMHDPMTGETFLVFQQSSERGTPIAMNSKSVCINNRDFVEALMKSIGITKKAQSTDVIVSGDLSRNEGEVVLRIEKQSNDDGQ